MSTRITGPVFDGRAAAAVEAYTRSVEDAVAARGKTLVLQRFGQVFQHPTGRYEATIHTDRVADGARVTDDGRTVYGPWLEGSGSRNYPRTVFRGYRTFRVVRQRLHQEAGAIATAALPPYLARME